MSEPSWLVEARRHIGQREIKGPKHNPWIVSLWRAIRRGGIKDDETPWCAAFVGACFEAVGIKSSRFESAASYLLWGQGMKWPLVGSVAVFQRPGGGHVGFVVGYTAESKLLVLGGNQGDSVSIAAFDKQRLVGVRWPPGLSMLEAEPIRLVDAAPASTSEA